MLKMMRHHIHQWPKQHNQVFVERDGSFGVVLSQMGAMVRTATGFASKITAQDWIARDTQLENADNPCRSAIPHILRHIECAPNAQP
jgi:hypothetical protein